MAATKLTFVALMPLQPQPFSNPDAACSLRPHAVAVTARCRAQKSFVLLQRRASFIATRNTRTIAFRRRLDFSMQVSYNAGIKSLECRAESREQEEDIPEFKSPLEELDWLIDRYPEDNRLLMARAVELLRAAQIEGSLEQFDKFLEREPEALAYMWQRGIAFYYAKQYEDGVKQFDEDMRVNGRIPEEVVWRYVCQAEEGRNADYAREQLLEIVSDPRPLMQKVYQMFSGDLSPEELVEWGEEAKNRVARFYANFYAGIFSEAQGEEDDARKYISAAAKTKGVEDDLMWSIARVHAYMRDWEYKD